ncbi:hypothetical protein IT072_02960 [Leifsonia sp. ZF2019]|uniref:exosortase/archaeosortase family protein n=1 Tax=Leifsonia sp. ZF2019 TaxID=2781978 RepID=UPI001CBD7886|nr:exosortase/archaeosortase family protein [Leifsonia sp. ZF2019]UAJ80050.1 hypothetical protein IT072_02960 [Leifsonia sp. ZF2019]
MGADRMSSGPNLSTDGVKVARTSRLGIPSGGRWVRITVALAFVAAAALILWNVSFIGTLEAKIGVWWMDLVLPGKIAGIGNSLVYNFENHARGVRVTAECSVAVLIVPVLLLGALVSGLTRVPLRRLFRALLVAVAVQCLVNQIRLALILTTYQFFGRSGFDLSHVLVGSFLSIIGVAFAFLLVVKSGRGEVRAKRRPAHA